MIQIRLDAKKLLKKLDTLERTFDQITEAFFLSVMDAFREVLARDGAAIKEASYDDMEIVSLGKWRGFDTYALVHPEAKATTDGSSGTMVVYVRNVVFEDKEAMILATHSPWPAEVIPAGMWKTQSLIVRRVSEAEYRSTVDRAVKERAMRSYLEHVGILKQGSSPAVARNTIENLELPDGLEASEDLAWVVLRHEYGIQGQSSRPHWRPAMREIKADLQEAWGEFIQDVIANGLSGPEVLTVNRDFRPDEIDAIRAFQEMVIGGPASRSG